LCKEKHGGYVAAKKERQHLRQAPHKARACTAHQPPRTRGRRVKGGQQAVGQVACLGPQPRVAAEVVRRCKAAQDAAAGGGGGQAGRQLQQQTRG
jgi:hypothetical protein